MKVTSTKKLSLTIAFFFACITGIFLLISHFAGFKYYFVTTVLAVFISFVLMFVIFYYLFNSYLINKLKPVFDTIDTLKMPAEKLYESIESGSLMQEMDKKVMEWAKNKLDEIAALKSNEKYRKEFLGDVSHELKTPLFNIQGYILTLIEGGIDDKEINIKYLKRTNKNINRLISIVKDLETIASFETGERQLEYEDFDLAKLISEVLDLYESKADDKKIKLKLENKSNQMIIAWADKKRISDVLSNLIVNSIIYGKEEGTTTVIIEQKKDKIYLSVADDGIGIAYEDQQRIFERFFRVDKSRSKLQGGTGLGLSIVKHIIEAHKQTISVNSKLKHGSIFTFTLDKAILNGK
ncbi:MAG: ATP-binding protein [Bacteroidales bacterium]